MQVDCHIIWIMEKRFKDNSKQNTWHRLKYNAGRFDSSMQDFSEVSVNCKIHQIYKVKTLCSVLQHKLFILDVRSYEPLSDNEIVNVSLCPCLC